MKGQKLRKSKVEYRKRWSLKRKYILLVVTLTLVPLLISYAIFIRDKIVDSQNYMKESLKEVADQMASNTLIQDKLAMHRNDGSIQSYTQSLLGYLKNVDLIVVADQSGEKYSHLDQTQVGDTFIGEDKRKVLETGESYYSLKEGSQGITLRYFRPIIKGQTQVGFVMVGKYKAQITASNDHILKEYTLLLGIVLGGTFLIAASFATHLKKIILDMEPEEIAALYLQKDSVLNSVQEGIIFLDANHDIQEENERARELLAYLPNQILLEHLLSHLEAREVLRMQEFILGDKKILVSLHPMLQENNYLGAVITLMDKEEVHEVAKEMMGIEERNKNLRATVHEFKNNLHVLLGLLQLEEYEEAKNYILEIQQIKTHRIEQFEKIQDAYLRAMLISRSIMAEEKQVIMQLTPSSYLMAQHGYVDENDLITILGNLIENAFEACSMSTRDEKWVEIRLAEDEARIQIEVIDNGIPIEAGLKAHLFELGISSKGKARGTGLYLLKKRLEIYHGTIEIKEEKEQKTFYVSIPKGAENE